MKKQEAHKETHGKGSIKRQYLSQADVPSRSLAQALRVGQAISDNYGKKPTRPLRVAQAMGIEPGSGNFRALCGASIAYGLTVGGYNADEISLTPLSKRIFAPTSEGDDAAAKKEAALRPKIIREFLDRYDGSALPQEKIGSNVLEEMGVPAERTKEVFALIVQTAKDLGFIQDLKGKSYVDLKSTSGSNGALNTLDEPGDLGGEDNSFASQDHSNGNQDDTGEDRSPDTFSVSSNKRVFITHGKNQTFIEPIKKLLQFGELEPVVAIERQSVAQPLTDKVMDEMRSCGAAIIHIDDEKRLIDVDGNQQVVLNPNVLIEIGAAIALYERRFILLVKNGTELPTNLKGLYEVRYDGDTLSSEVTIKLLEAIKEMKNHPSPSRYNVTK